MICDPDPDLGMANQLSSILRLLLDSENMLTASTGYVSLPPTSFPNIDLTLLSAISLYLFYSLNYRNLKRTNFSFTSTNIVCMYL